MTLVMRVGKLAFDTAPLLSIVQSGRVTLVKLVSNENNKVSSNDSGHFAGTTEGQERNGRNDEFSDDCRKLEGGFANVT